MYHIFQLSGQIEDKAKPFASVERQKKDGGGGGNNPAYSMMMPIIYLQNIKTFLPFSDLMNFVL